MGLDMYLASRAFVYDSEHFKAEPKKAAATRALADLLNLPLEDRLPDENGQFTCSAIFSVNSAYWRKANAIHNFIVQHHADGVDECQDIVLQPRDVQSLRNLCLLLLIKKDPELAKEHLPPQSGFFFGSTEINDWYWEDLELTVSQLDRCLASSAEDFVYHASW